MTRSPRWRSIAWRAARWHCARHAWTRPGGWAWLTVVHRDRAATALVAAVIIFLIRAAYPLFAAIDQAF